ncbi:unnamed protein product [Didymodactylos carnosus]|uniref:Sulfatase N-terminal domain-containing protein n=1 Tax=Didymodactylos carnosus TaxID=1234261 RepID=A0A8S2F801_9BILA|nr:unnamed protein product [Didymodactylos carnosus]CAF4188493.1 unnamed protein product [Didymodactylos carnosus]
MPHPVAKAQPNFLVIVADDLGWSDVSSFGSEINTPNLEMLANSGTRFTDFHTASACSPTRSMLMSGTDNHIAGFGQLAEVVQLHQSTWEGKAGYEGYLNDRVAALPEILQDAGYFTTMSGKWHLGITEDRFPKRRGFDDSFALLPGAGNHYAYEIAVPFLPPLYARNDEFVNHTTLKDYYSSDYFATELIASLKSNAGKNAKPFFAYLAFTAPHWPLQAPAELVAKYKGVYDGGPAVLREKRLENQRKAGLLSPDTVPSPVHTDQQEWDKLTPDEQAFSAKTMAIFAAMVERVDFAIGRVVDYLKQIDQFENTFILFMSDNGAEGVILEAIPILSPALPVQYFNNSYDNIGNKDSFMWYGPRWAQASTAPSRMSKGYITEGGIRCPAIVHYPGFGTPLNISHEFTTVMDIVPTILELAGIPHPGTTFRNRTVVTPRGKSWVSHLLNSDEHVHHVHGDHDFIGWELFGQRAIRRGNYKAIWIPNESHTEKWELYDLTQDKGELINLADEQNDVLNELIEAWLVYEAETGVIIADDGWAVRYPPDIFGIRNPVLSDTQCIEPNRSFVLFLLAMLGPLGSLFATT